MKQKDIDKIKQWLIKPKRIAIAIHYNPDGDAIGSALALARFLQKSGHRTSVLAPNSFPDFLQWMPFSDAVLFATDNLQQCQTAIDEAELIFCLDFNAFSRAGALEKMLENSSVKKVLIDHHIDPQPSFDIVYSICGGTSSTCELIFQFIVDILGEKYKIDKQIAECIYVGMITDTGSLSYGCNNSSTYKVLDQLMDFGLDGEQIHRRIYDTYTQDRIRLLGYCLSERLTVFDDRCTSFMFLTKEDLEQYHYKQGDTEGFVNYGLSINTVRFTAFFSERDDRIRISFRSKGNFDVNVFAREHFNGGGHKNASGGNSYDDMPTTLKRFVDLLDQYKEKLNQPWDEVE